MLCTARQQPQFSEFTQEPFYASPVNDEALEVLSLSGISSRQCILATLSRKQCCEAPLKRAGFHTQQPIETTGTRRRNIALRLGAGPFCILFWASKRVWRLAGRDPPFLLTVLVMKKGNRLTIRCPETTNLLITSRASQPPPGSHPDQRGSRTAHPAQEVL
jgi:hypothetical protein